MTAKEINPKIINGTGALVSEITGYSSSYVSLVLSGKRTNSKIDNAVNDIFELQQILIKKYKK